MRLKGFLTLMRPVNCLMMGFAVLIGAYLVDVESIGFSIKLALGFITAFTLAGTAMVVNDYYDRKIDAINEPNRPIPSGLVKPREALLFAAFLTFIGLLSAFLTNLNCLLIAISAYFILVAYTTKGKRTGFLGNLMVSTCVAIPFIYGGFITSETLSPITYIFSVLAFLANTGREITKGIVDVEGDARESVKTIAVLYGKNMAAVTASIFYISAILLSLLPPLLGMVSIYFVPPVLIADSGFLASSILLVRKPSRENARRIKNLALLWMIAGLVAFMAGKI